MAKYIDIENATLNWEEADKQGVGDDFIGGVLFALDALTAKEEDIVRCKGCKYVIRKRTVGRFPYLVCNKILSEVPSDGYCHYGARKDA